MQVIFQVIMKVLKYVGHVIMRVIVHFIMKLIIQIIMHVNMQYAQVCLSTKPGHTILLVEYQKERNYMNKYYHSWAELSWLYNSFFLQCIYIIYIYIY